MNRNDFINWLDRPLTDTDEKIIDTLLDMIESYDNNIKLIEELLLKINKIQKDKLNEIKSENDIEVLYEE